MPPAGFKPITSASKRQQTHALVRAAIDIGHNFISVMNFSFQRINITLSKSKNPDSPVFQASDTASLGKS